MRQPSLRLMVKKLQSDRKEMCGVGDGKRRGVLPVQNDFFVTIKVKHYFSNEP